MTMIPQDKDRFECLRLAVALLVPRSNAAGSSQVVVQAVLAAAEQFYQYVTSADAPAAENVKRHNDLQP